MKLDELTPRLTFADALDAMRVATTNTAPGLVALAVQAMIASELQRLSDAVVLVADAIHGTGLVTAGDGQLEPSLAGIEPAIVDLTRVIQEAACRSRFSRGKR